MASGEKKFVLVLASFSATISFLAVVSSICHLFGWFRYGMNIYFAIIAFFLCTSDLITVAFRLKTLSRYVQPITFIVMFIYGFFLYYRVLGPIVPDFIFSITSNIVISGSVFVVLFWVSLGTELYIHSLPIIDLEFFPDSSLDTTKDVQIEEDRPLHPCIICYAKSADCLFLPCAHLICCHDCGKKLSTCPMDRKPLEKIVLMPSTHESPAEQEEAAGISV
ncbi:hypothetical protein GEMRC1_003670 [Eukaryota sp. GEM-RC1]